MKTVQEYTREACPICGKKGWCGRREDGLILCKRPPSPPEVSGYTFRGTAKDGQTAMFVEAGKEYRQLPKFERPARKQVARPPSKPDAAEIFTGLEDAFTSERRVLLAEELGLPECAFDALRTGWSEAARHHGDQTATGAWVFSECDGQGRIIGMSYRFPQSAIDGKTDAEGTALGGKSAPAGFRRGLTLPIYWREMPDPILIVEGASDVLAGRAVGLSVIGRPSNVGGAEHIAQACRLRRVIILGENDRKDDGRWPGKEGAGCVARKLEAAWGRPVPVAFPLAGIKDLRDWTKQLVSDWSADLSSVRGCILEAVSPPELLLLAEPQRRGRPVVKIFTWSGGADALPLYADRLDTQDAAARRRFAKEVSKLKPDIDTDDLMRRLLVLEVRPVQKEAASTSTHNVAFDPSQPEQNQFATVFLPGGPTTILESAKRLGNLLAQTGNYFIRGGSAVTVGRDDESLPILVTLKPTSLASAFETVSTLMTYVRSRNGFSATETICSEQTAKLIQDCSAFRNALPPIRVLSRCPVPIERDGQLIQISSYDRESGILAFGDPVPEVELSEATVLLSEMIADFRFATPSDRARALAAMITPAMIFGAFLGGRAPVDLGEADQSQTGKGFRNKLTAAIYSCKVKTVTQKKGGVGSLEESFASALLRGYNFISFDNVRGAIDSPAVESFLTEDSFFARTPYMAAVEIDPRRTLVQLTSNQADITIDLANRSACVSLLKQLHGYRFRQYPEGDILDHVRANQPRYLGAVFSVVRAWHTAGKPKTNETRHDFRAWARTLDWIVQNIFHAPPLLDGHRETQIRMGTPVLNWLRSVALAVRQAESLDIPLRASDILEIISENSLVEVPGLPEAGGDISDEPVRKHVLQAIGRKLALCFKGSDAITIGDMRIERAAGHDELRRDIRTYRFICAAVSPMETDFSPIGSPNETAVSPILPYSLRDFLNCGQSNESCMEIRKRDMRQPDITQMSETSGGIGEHRGIRHFHRNKAEAPIGGIGESDTIGESNLSEPSELRGQAEALVKGRSDADDLLYIFDEREAIASIDGQLDPQAAGQMAYKHLQREVQENTTQHVEK